MEFVFYCWEDRHVVERAKPRWAVSIFYRICPVCGLTRIKKDESARAGFGPPEVRPQEPIGRTLLRAYQKARRGEI